MNKQTLPMWVLPLGGLLTVVPGWAQERVAMPPVQPSARGVTVVNDCELRLAKMNSGSCPQACMERRPRAGTSLTTSDVCVLANETNWECRWPLVQTPQNGLTCPTGWNGTYDVQIMNESRNCGAQLVEVGRTVARNGCTRVVPTTRTQSCPAGWTSGTILQRGTMTQQLNNDLTTFRQVGSTTWLPLVNSDVTCSRDVTTAVSCPTGGFANSGGSSTGSYSQVKREVLAADLVSVAQSTVVSNNASSCPPYNCTASTPGAVCVQTSWTGNANNNREVCDRYMCGNVSSVRGGTSSGGGGGGYAGSGSVASIGGGTWSGDGAGVKAGMGGGWVQRDESNPLRGIQGGGQQTGNSGPSGRTVICTYFMQKGELERDLWLASAKYGRDYVHPATLRGYHLWAVPYVRLMRKSPLAERVMRPIMLARSEEIGYRMGVRAKPNYAGKAISVVMEPLCFMLGLLAPAQDWESLWASTASTGNVHIS